MDNLKSFFISIVLECCHLNNTQLNTECLDNSGILNEEDNTHKNEHCHFKNKKYSDDLTSTEITEARNFDAHDRYFL